MKTYLDEQGLALLWQKITEMFSSYYPNIPRMNADDIDIVFDNVFSNNGVFYIHGSSDLWTNVMNRYNA